MQPPPRIAGLRAGRRPRRSSAYFAPHESPRPDGPGRSGDRDWHEAGCKLGRGRPRPTWAPHQGHLQGHNEGHGDGHGRQVAGRGNASGRPGVRPEGRRPHQQGDELRRTRPDDLLSLHHHALVAVTAEPRRCGGRHRAEDGALRRGGSRRGEALQHLGRGRRRQRVDPHGLRLARDRGDRPVRRSRGHLPGDLGPAVRGPARLRRPGDLARPAASDVGPSRCSSGTR